MASDGFGKIRPKKHKASTKPYDANRKESFFGRMKSKVKDMLTPSWLSTPAVAIGDSDTDGDCEAGLEEALDSADGAALAPAATGKGLSSALDPGASFTERRESTQPGALPTSLAAAPRVENSVAATDDGTSRLGDQATAAGAVREKAADASSVFPDLEIRKRVRREFFHMADGGVQEKRHRPTRGLASDGGGSTSSSLTVVPDKSDSYQRDILLMSKRSLEHHRHDLAPKESESTESELTATASVSNNSTAVFLPPNSTVAAETPNESLSQLIKPSFSIATFTSSLTSLSESASFLNASALGESSFYAGKTTFGGASAYRKTPLAVPVAVQPSNRSALYAKRPNGPGATAVTSATAKRILDTLEKIASPSLTLSRSKDAAASIVSQSATDALLAFKPLPSFNRRRVQPAEKAVSQPKFSSQDLPPVAKLPTVNAASRKWETVTFDTNTAPKASHPHEQGSLLPKVESASSTKQSKLEYKSDEPQSFGPINASDKAGGKLKPGREKTRTHYSRPSNAPEEDEQISTAPTLSVAFTLPAESVKGIDLINVKLPVPVLSGADAAKSGATRTVSGAVHAQYMFSAPVALPTTLPAAETKISIPTFTFRQPADPGDASVPRLLTSSESRNVPKAKADTAVTKVTEKAVPPESKQEASAATVVPAVTTDTTSVHSLVQQPAVGLPVAPCGSSLWGGTLLAGASAGGGWECEACLVSNKPEASKCCACGSSKRRGGVAAAVPPSPAAAPPAPATFLPPSTVGTSRVDIFNQPQTGWECSACLVRNKSEEKKCVACGAPGASSAEVPHVGSSKATDKALVDIFKQAPTGWECGSCLIRNSVELSKCSACSTTKPGSISANAPAVLNAAPAPDIFKQSVGGWECGTCLIRNPSEKSICAACGSSKPGASVGTLTVSAVQNAGESKRSASGNGFGSIFNVAAGSWTCAECLVQNKPDALKCVACDSRKPGSADSSLQDKQQNGGDKTLPVAAGTAVSDQNKGCAAIKFGGAQCGPSAFSVGFKPLPVVPKFGGQQPAVATIVTAKEELTSSGAPLIATAGSQAGLFKSFQAPAVSPSVAFGGSLSTVPSRAPTQFSFGIRPADDAGGKTGQSIDGAARPSFAFGSQSAKDEIKTSQQDAIPSMAKPVSVFGGFQGAIGSTFNVAKAEEPSFAAAVKPFAFGSNAASSSLGGFGSGTSSSCSTGISVSGALSSGSVGFNFGSHATQSKPADPTSVFKFGGASSQTQGSADAAVKIPTPAFGTGLPKPAGNPSATFTTPVFGSSTPASIPGGTGFSGFGTSASSSGFSFGQAASNTAVSTSAGGGFAFGNPNPKSDAEHVSRPFVFGSGAGSTAPSGGTPATLFGKRASSQVGEASSTLPDESNPFAPSQGVVKREIRKVARKFTK